MVFAVIRIVTALFLKETLASAANDADMQMDELRGKSKDYQRNLAPNEWGGLQKYPGGVYPSKMDGESNGANPMNKWMIWGAHPYSSKYE